MKKNEEEEGGRRRREKKEEEKEDGEGEGVLENAGQRLFFRPASCLVGLAGWKPGILPALSDQASRTAKKNSHPIQALIRRHHLFDTQTPRSKCPASPKILQLKTVFGKQCQPAWTGAKWLNVNPMSSRKGARCWSRFCLFVFCLFFCPDRNLKTTLGSRQRITRTADIFLEKANDSASLS